MRFSFVIAALAFLIALLLDWYIVSRIKKRCPGNTVIKKVYIVLAVLSYIVLTVGIALPRASASNGYLVADMWLLYAFVTTLVTRVAFCVWDWLSLIPRHFKLGWGKYLSYTGVIIAIGVFGVTWWGALINRNRISVTRFDVPSSQWPQAFDNFTIAQISDLHVGTWGNDTTFLSKLVERVNSLNPDMIVFTGDIVNREADEFVPMVSTFSRLRAPFGVYAVMGNHDYGDYRYWENESDHKADPIKLHELYARTGHRLLLNETEWIKKGNDSIALIGVENIGDPPFHTYGDLNLAYPTLNDSHPKILLSHNPAHWVNDIKDKRSADIALTLAGHTHAMQMQVGHLTPATLRYPTAWGLYEDSMGRYLFVNRGSGTVGMPMRIGATPEITLLTLKADTAHNNNKP